MPILDTTFEIDAPVATVWEALTDFPRYGEWNLALPSLTGEARVGSTLTAALALGPTAKPMNVQADVLALDPDRRFSWRGNLGADALFTGLREFTLESLGPTTTRVRHLESLTGLIAPVFYAVKRKGVDWHHHELNASLKRRAEDLAARP